MTTRVGIWFEIQISFHFAVRQRRTRSESRSCRNTQYISELPLFCSCWASAHQDAALSDLIASACCATLMGTNEIKVSFFQFPPILSLSLFPFLALFSISSSFLFASCFYISLFFQFFIFIPFSSSGLSNGHQELFIWGKVAGVLSWLFTPI
jgi:hypothetical protein